MEVKSSEIHVQEDQEKTIISSISKEAVVIVDDEDDVEDDDGPLPGFRFHPTDEELVSFYLKRKVEKRRPLSIEIIKQIDIYKHDPWDLAKASSSVGDKEWYFYCKRGRKYRNSIRPNRVTGSGFWKATGIDRPIYSNGGEGHHRIGLKKSLVYYRGSAGKGTKTDWMMHEFRLPTTDIHQHHHNFSNPKDTAIQAEIWTLCRIFKRNKKHTPDWRELSSRKNNAVNLSSSKTSSIDSTTNQECYISFANTHQVAPPIQSYNTNLHVTSDESNDIYLEKHNNNAFANDQKNLNFHADYYLHQQQQWSSMAHQLPPYALMNQVLTNDDNDMRNLGFHGWDDLNSVVEFAFK